MANTIKIAYGSTAGTTAKNNSAQGELSFSPTNNVLWIGKGSNTQIAIGGAGKFVTLDNVNQTIEGVKTFSSTITGSISGTAGSAATWTTARTFTIGSTGKSVNGSANISWTLGEIGAAATSHSHGNITSAGAIGSTASLPIITTTSGVLTTGSFGTAANTFCQGNDSRLSNARTPVGTFLQTGYIYVGDSGFVAASVPLSGDATLSGTGSLTIANNAITTAKIANNAVTVDKMEQVVGRGILGRNANTTGNLSEIAASATGQILTSTSTGLQWSGSVLGWNTMISLNGDTSQLPSLPSNLDYTELYYTSHNGKLYSVRGNDEDEDQEDIILLCGGTQMIMYSDAAPEAEDTYLVLSSLEKIRLTKVTFVCGAGTCTNAKLKKISGVNTSDIVTFSVNTTISNTTSLNTTHREIAIGDRLLFNPGTLSSGTTPEDLVLQIEYIPGAESNF